MNSFLLWLESAESETFLRKLLYWTALLLAILVLLGNCAQPVRVQSAAPVVQRGTRATLYAHNTMRVDVDVYISRAGYADIYLGSLRPMQRDTFIVVIPAGTAYTYRVQNPSDWRFRAETLLIFIRSEPVVFEWIIRTPLSMQLPTPRRAK